MASPPIRTWMPVLFAGTAFAGAMLLFLIQPMFARLLLPVLGGSPAVWTTCMLFFQAALLAGYGYAHLAPRLLGARRQAALHALLVWTAFLTLPIALRPITGKITPWIVPWTLATTALSVGLPFVMLASTAPLLQHWFATIDDDRRGDPYSLYVASNAGSLVALLAYPLFVEPRLTLSAQAAAWTGGYALVSCGITACAAFAIARGTRSIAAARPLPSDAIPLGRRWHWVGLAWAPSSLMLGVTTFLTTDVAPVPLLWVLPLAVYLASFMATFGANRARWVGACRRALPLLLLPEALLLALRTGLPIALYIALHLATFGALAVLCHGRLAEDRPAVSRLTEFYLWLAIGGALGGVFNSVVAPHVFSDLTEYPLVLVAACALLASSGDLLALASPRTWIRPLAAAGVLAAAIWVQQRWQLSIRWITPAAVGAVLLSFSLSRQPARFAASVGLLLFGGSLVSSQTWGDVLSRTRTFFGVYRVAVDRDRQFRTLYHGTTIHGRERIGQTPPEPLTYYHRGSPIGEVFATRAARSVGAIGLGVGSLAAYAQPTQAWTFYEIDPEVERLARYPQWFHFLERCGSSCTVVVGDGRLALEASRNVHDIIVLDAFSSDAVPLHLLTLEAGAVYLKHLAPDGLLAFHISNRHLNLGEVAARFATSLQLAVIGRADLVPPDDASGRSSSVWVVMARERDTLNGLAARPGWKWLTPDPRRAWSDDFSSLWGIVRWSQ